MAFLVGGANSAAADTGYDIENSLRLNDDDAAILTYTPAGTSSDASKRKYTFSFWVKRGNITDEQNIINWGKQTGSDDFGFFFDSNDTFRIYDYGDDFGGSGYHIDKITSRLFRDPSAWYHIILIVDTTDGTAGDRVKVYINGVRETSFGTSVDPDQNYAGFVGSADACDIGWGQDASGKALDAYISEFHYIDGTAKAHTDFGEFDEDSGIWKPKEYTGGSYGTNGFFLEFKQSGTDQDASGIGADTSGNDNHLAVTNLAATDQTTDTPTNNFATLNPIDKAGSGAITFSEGNLKAAVEDNGNARGNFFVNSGKWYWETLIVSGDSVSTVGIAEPGYYSGNLFDGSSTAKGYIYINDGNKRSPAGSAGAYGDSYADDDIIGVALNMDDGEVTFYKNNATQDVAFSSLSGDHGIYYQGYGGTATVILNTGNPAFSISSGNADANGYGNFEYAPPNGFYALCTKNLAEYG
jgi:hypothetical protein